VGGLARRLDPLIPQDRLRQINDAHLASLGADPASLGIEYDIFPRPGRPDVSVAFTMAMELPPRLPSGGFGTARSQVFATYETGSLGNLAELLHESGHAIQDSAIRVRPLLAGSPSSHTAFWEAFADIVGWDASEPSFIAHHLGVSVSRRDAIIERYGGVVLDASWALFEMELHRHPTRRPNDVWAEIVELELGVRGHPEWSWWATRTQLIDGPGYLANYALGAVMVAAVRARIRSLRGDWSGGDAGWYAFVSSALLQWAGAREPSAILRDFLGGPLTADALLADIRSGGEAA
ncbi:MAG: hypothetical protein L0221_13730, partial [Chloroflexi bacterium]|nr:hypothetical protein [Chloroflexota bacterium]